MKTLFITLFSALLFSVAGAQDAKALYADGLVLKTDKKIEEAVQKFEQAIALSPGYTDAIYESGWCYNDLKKYDKAIAALRKARNGWPGIAKVYHELGYAFQKTSQTDSAISAYKRCLEINPEYSNVPKQLAYLYYDKLEYATALGYCKKFEDISKAEITDYLYWYRKGFMLNAEKDFNSAITALENSKQYKADYLNTWLELGFAHSRLKKNDEAIGFYKKAIELDPKSHIGYNGIGEVYRDNVKDMDMAISWYEKALAINPEERKAHFGIGYCLNSKGKYSDAVSHLKKAIEVETTYTAAFVELGYSYYMLGMDSDALSNFSKALTLNSKNENARYYSCMVYIKQKNKAMAQKMVDELKTLSSKHVLVLQPKVDAM